ncbi:type I-F CRISPR-associated protein Csy1 [Pasteurella atlantica]|uniref:type I-F CRISPR-associated protein Csy1 n=1 Tax=Pasteurellaceae TaxID=712 RepID=UPI00274F9C16|nr:type I-F CRISPR-associated protein Csy1 [Pasteurella atlantica]MDP8098586.1 type I-F CRISPR-associated protein Csy1 [Pasteurella atlantica]MDP8106722.1 type I-F CRISPR-associated protein Csy1 [Pasteurella atlantica]MDP8116413.1 type I-F CRISPR-associated protein Csy1 [Pasteurella atlantica]
MKKITIQTIENSIIDFLNDELEKELLNNISKMKGVTEKKINDRRVQLKSKSDFNFLLWLEELKKSIEFMRAETLSLMTHSAKGIHSALKTDNILMKTNNKLPTGILGFQDINTPKIDANSNNTGSHAGHLKIIVNFLNIELLNDRIYQWIVDDNDVVQTFLNNISANSFDYFQHLLKYETNNPISDAKNKQLLFPINHDIYHCIVPLYPSVTCNHLYYLIKNITDKSKQIRKKIKDGKDGENYRDILNLAYIKLGGDNAQNVTRLNNEQGGRNYLLPSIPPTFSQRYRFNVSKSARTIFNKNLAYQCYKPIEQCFQVVKSPKNTVDIRDARKFAIDEILHILFSISTYIKNTYPAGWSKDYQLDYNQKLWLDPLRANLEGEEEFAEDREDLEWHLEIYRQFANWLNKLIQDKFPHLKHDTGKPEYNEWRREIMDMKKQYERAGKGVFL